MRRIDRLKHHAKKIKVEDMEDTEAYFAAMERTPFDEIQSRVQASKWMIDNYCREHEIMYPETSENYKSLFKLVPGLTCTFEEYLEDEKRRRVLESKYMILDYCLEYEITQPRSVDEYKKFFGVVPGLTCTFEEYSYISQK